MGTLPALTVLLDDGTGTFPFDISSKVLAAESYSITRGRDDWIGAVTAGELTLTLNNSDGRFTPGSTIIASPSPIKIDQRIRVKETINGTTYSRFTGYLKSLPVAWPAVVPTFSTVTITATDAQARAERRTLRAPITESVLSDSPSLYYTLGEAEGSTSAGDTSGNQGPSMNPAGTGTAVVFGVDVGSGQTAAQFAGGKYLQAANTQTYIGTGAFTIEAVYKRTNATAPSGAGPEESIVGATTDAGVTPHYSLGLTSDGSGFVDFVFFSNIATPSNRPGQTNVCDGEDHHIAVTYNGATTIQVYVDGAADGGTVSGTVTVPTAVCNQLQIGNGIAELTNGTVRNVVITDGIALSAADILEHANAALGAAESGTARLTRLAGYAGIPVGTLDSSLTTVAFHDWTDSSAFEAMQAVQDAEVGLVFIDGSGNLAFHNRDEVRVKTTPDLTLDSQYVTPDVVPVVDDERLVNYVEATVEGTGATLLVRDTDSETSHGRYPGSQSYLVQTDQEAIDRASWTIAKLAEPVDARYGTLTINLYKMTAAQASTVLSKLDLDCWLRVTTAPSQNPGGTTIDVVVQGWREDTTGESWTITCNVVAHSLFTAGIYDNATLGVYDTSIYGI